MRLVLSLLADNDASSLVYVGLCVLSYVFYASVVFTNIVDVREKK